MKSLKYSESYQNETEPWSEQMLLEKWCQQTFSPRVATNLHFVENTVSLKCNEAKHNKMKYACIDNSWQFIPMNSVVIKWCNTPIILYSWFGIPYWICDTKPDSVRSSSRGGRKLFSSWISSTLPSVLGMDTIIFLRSVHPFFFSLF